MREWGNLSEFRNHSKMFFSEAHNTALLKEVLDKAQLGLIVNGDVERWKSADFAGSSVVLRNFVNGETWVYTLFQLVPLWQHLSSSTTLHWRCVATNYSWSTVRHSFFKKNSWIFSTDFHCRSCTRLPNALLQHTRLHETGQCFRIHRSEWHF